MLAFLLKIENDNLYFGKMIYPIFNCKQNPVDSFPCYATWDIALLSIGTILCIYVLISAVLDIIRNKKKIK